MKTRLGILDALRGSAAIFVVIYHYTYTYFQIYPQVEKLPFSISVGHYGVEMFFIISGFVIFMTLERTKKSLDFIVHRFIRLYPTFWLSIILTTIVFIAFPLPERTTPLGFDLLANFTMIHTQFKIQSVDGVYWTLLYELKFYFWMFILFATRNLRHIEMISIFLLLITLVCYLVGVTETTLYHIFLELFFSSYISFFIAGIMFYKIFKKEAKYSTYLVLGLSFIVSMVASENRIEEYYLIVIPIIYILFTLLSLHKLHWLAIKPLIFLGSISYALYLIHQIIGFIIINQLQMYSLPSYLGIFLAILFSISLATIITYLFEKNVMQYLKSKYNNYIKNKYEKL